MPTEEMLRAVAEWLAGVSGKVQGTLHVLAWDRKTGKGAEATIAADGSIEIQSWTVEEPSLNQIRLRRRDPGLPLVTLEQARTFCPKILHPLELDVDEPEHLVPELGRGLPATPPSTPPAPDPPAPPALTDPRLRERHRRLLAVATKVPRRATELARAAGFTLTRGKANAYVYGALRDLVRWEFLRYAPGEGYRLP